MKKIIILAIMLGIFASCSNSQIPNGNTQETSSENTQKIQVTSSIIPISSVIHAIGGEYVEVDTIVPAGVSPHGFDLSARQMVDISESEIVFMVGLESIDGFLQDASAQEKQVHLADGIELLEAAEHSHEKHEDEHEDEEDHVEEHADEENHDEHEDEHENEHDEHSVDAHVWLGKENIFKIADSIKSELTQILPEHAEYFATNTNIFKIEIEQIYADFAAQTAGKSPQEFIVFHDAYNYLMQSAQIDSKLRIPFSENVLHETGTTHMAELIEEIEIHGVEHVFREPQFSDGNLQSFASQYNLSVAVLDPIGTDDSAAGYSNNLKNNLQSLSQIYE